MWLSMPNMRDAAKMLAMTPEVVATIARATVNQTPTPPSAGRAARVAVRVDDLAAAVGDRGEALVGEDGQCHSSGEALHGGIDASSVGTIGEIGG